MHSSLQARFDQLLSELYIRPFTSMKMRISAGWRSSEIYSSYWRLYVNNRDGAVVEMSGRNYPLEGKTVHFVPPWIRFNFYSSVKLEHNFLHFDIVGLSAALIRQLFPLPVTLSAGSGLRQQGLEWASDLGNPEKSTLELACQTKSLAYRGLAQLFGRLNSDQQDRCYRYLRGNHPIMPAIEYIESHLSEPLNNDSLAKLCHVSSDHFIRLFQKWTDQTPAQYILEQRIKSSAQQLVFTNLTIDQIAEKCGFLDRFYFSRVFNKRMGLPPAAYRKSSRM